jgi:hypothetical protein
MFRKSASSTSFDGMQVRKCGTERIVGKNTSTRASLQNIATGTDLLHVRVKFWVQRPIKIRDDAAGRHVRHVRKVKRHDSHQSIRPNDIVHLPKKRDGIHHFETSSKLPRAWFLQAVDLFVREYIYTYIKVEDNAPEWTELPQKVDLRLRSSCRRGRMDR